MEHVIVAFHVRAQTIAFSSFLKDNGVYNQIVNTPKEAGVGCGLSVQVSPSQLEIVKRALSVGAFNSFAGVFKVKISGGGRSVKSI